MREYKIIGYVAVHIIKNIKDSTVGSLCIRNANERKRVKRLLAKNGISGGKWEQSGFWRSTGADLTAKLWGGGRNLTVEAKGANSKGKDVYYAIYTALGQFLCGKDKSGWFALAFPASWRKKVVGLLTEKGKPKAMIALLMDQCMDGNGNNSQLYFYFVGRNGDVEAVTWREVLRKQA